MLLFCLLLLSACSKDHKIPVTSATIDDNCTIFMGETKTLHATLLPENATNKFGAWISSDPNVATVIYQGVLTGIRDGSAEVTMTIDGVRSNVCIVTVLYRDVPIESIAINERLLITEGDIKSLNTTITPYYTTEETIAWKSSDESVVMVDKDGNVTAIKEGVAEITAVSEACTSNKCVVTVLKDVIINIPNTAFKNYVLNKFDANLDGVLSQKEALEIEVVDVEKRYITSLDGIQYFYHLKELYCTDNILSKVDLSKNIELEILSCGKNNLTELDLLKNTLLEVLSCEDNRLTELFLSYNTSLEILYCQNNRLPRLSVSNNKSLVEINCSDNRIASLSLPQNGSLQKLFCGRNELTSVDVSDLSDGMALEIFYCEENQISSLDLSDNGGLIDLNCNNNKLSKLLLPKTPTLLYVWVDENKLTEIDVYGNTGLVELHCANNQLEGNLNVLNNEALKELSCFGNSRLKTITVRKGQELWIYPDEHTIIKEE